VVAKLTRFLFGVTDTVIGLSMVVGVIGLIRVLFWTLDASFSPAGLRTDSLSDLFMIWGSFVAVVIWAVVAFFAWFLLIRRQILGLAVLVVLGPIGFLMPLIDQPAYALIFYPWVFAAQVAVLSLPWIVTCIDMKRRGALSPTGDL